MSGEALWAWPALRAVLGGVLGLIFGSFVGATVVRMPAAVSPLSGRSRCDGCGRALGPAELVPLAAWLALRGRCRTCGAAIDPWQPAAELGGAVVGASAAVVANGWPAFALSFALGLQLLLLALLDLRHFWLPDRLVLLLAATGLTAALLRYGWSPRLLSESLAGCVLGFGLLWLAAAGYRRLRKREGMGAGDPKLLGALGLWLGPLGVLVTVLGASLTGLAAATALALGGRRVSAQTALPLGGALCLAGWVVWLGRFGGGGGGGTWP